MKKTLSLILALITLLFCLVACDNSPPIAREENRLEDGFKPSNSAEAPSLYCAYRSDKTEFPIDDVTLDFYYGGYYYQGVEYELENTHDIPSFELYFQDDYGGKFFIRRFEYVANRLPFL